MTTPTPFLTTDDKLMLLRQLATGEISQELPIISPDSKNNFEYDGFWVYVIQGQPSASSHNTLTRDKQAICFTNYADAKKSLISLISHDSVMKMDRTTMDRTAEQPRESVLFVTSEYVLRKTIVYLNEYLAAVDKVKAEQQRLLGTFPSLNKLVASRGLPAPASALKLTDFKLITADPAKAHTVTPARVYQIGSYDFDSGTTYMHGKIFLSLKEAIVYSGSLTDFNGAKINQNRWDKNGNLYSNTSYFIVPLPLLNEDLDSFFASNTADVTAAIEKLDKDSLRILGL